MWCQAASGKKKKKKKKEWLWSEGVPSLRIRPGHQSRNTLHMTNCSDVTARSRPLFVLPLTCITLIWFDPSGPLHRGWHVRSGWPEPSRSQTTDDILSVSFKKKTPSDGSSTEVIGILRESFGKPLIPGDGEEGAQPSNALKAFLSCGALCHQFWERGSKNKGGSCASCQQSLLIKPPLFHVVWYLFVYLFSLSKGFNIDLLNIDNRLIYPHYNIFYSVLKSKTTRAGWR